MSPTCGTAGTPNLRQSKLTARNSLTPATRIVFGGGGRGVRDVLVDGTLLVRDGIPMTLDPADVRAKGAEAQAALLKRAALA